MNVKIGRKKIIEEILSTSIVLNLFYECESLINIINITKCSKWSDRFLICSKSYSETVTHKIAQNSIKVHEEM